MVNNTHSFSLVKDTGPNTAMVSYTAYYVTFAVDLTEITGCRSPQAPSRSVPIGYVH